MFWEALATRDSWYMFVRATNVFAAARFKLRGIITKLHRAVERKRCEWRDKINNVSVRQSLEDVELNETSIFLVLQLTPDDSSQGKGYVHNIFMYRVA